MLTGQALAVESCIANASTYHGVNSSILSAIMMVESNYKPGTVTRNSNNTSDIGMGGINTIHLPKLKEHGIAPTDLLNPCVNSYVAAWHLRQKMNQYGNTWFAIAAYHSATPYYNQRYQVLLHNALIELKVIDGRKMPVPPLKPETRAAGLSDKRLESNQDRKQAATDSTMTVLN